MRSGLLNSGSSPAWLFLCLVTEYFAEIDRQAGSALVPAPYAAGTAAGRAIEFYHKRNKRRHDASRADIETQLASFVPKDALRTIAAQSYIDERLEDDALLLALASEIAQIKKASITRSASTLEGWRPLVDTRHSLIAGAALGVLPAASCAAIAKLLQHEGVRCIDRYHVRRSLNAFAQRELRLGQSARNLLACRLANYSWRCATYCWKQAREYFETNRFALSRWPELQESGLLFVWRGEFERGALTDPPACAIEELVRRLSPKKTGAPVGTSSITKPRLRLVPEPLRD